MYGRIKKFFRCVLKRISQNRYTSTYIMVLFFIAVTFFIIARHRGDPTPFFMWLYLRSIAHIEGLVTVISIFIAVLTIEQNAKISEAKLIKELNSEFISNEGLAQIESKLEKYFSDYRANGNSPIGIDLDINRKLGESDRQNLVNYLVHLEAIAALVNAKVLRLNAVNDLMSYRFFLAMNNPHVQELELNAYAPYYSGCIQLYSRWNEKMKYDNIPIPMEKLGKVILKLASEIKNGQWKPYLAQEALATNKDVHGFVKEMYETKEELKENPTAYFYDLAVIRKNIRRLQKDLPPQTKLYYSMKANPHDKVLDCICNESFVTGIEIASAGELEVAERHCKSENIIFTGPGKTEYELEQAIQSGIRFINVESMAEAVRIENIAESKNIDKVDVLLRINLDLGKIPDVENMTGYSTKMGIDQKDYIDTYQKIQQMDRVCVKGIHAFAASGVLDYQTLIKIDDNIFGFVQELQKKVGEVSVIDFGGGLGIDYTTANRLFDTQNYGKQLRNLIDKYGYGDKEIIMELGTYLVGNAGYYTSEIIDIKEVKGKKQIVLAGGVNHMGLPLEMRRKHPVTILQRNKKDLYPGQPEVRSEVVDISGPLCIVSDKLSWDQYIERARIGDIAIYTQAGAYCYGEGLVDFLMHERPLEFVFTSSKVSKDGSEPKPVQPPK